ncbi:MAG: MFS transporter, partial [Coriobacteriia bacterium]|nr:MFS transporter [Coriobacteriia bacterium]
MTIAKRLDALPMTPMVRKVLLFAGLGWLFDAMDQGMVSGVIASIGSSWQLSTAQLGLLGSAGTLGMILGAALSGFAADRWGRRTVMLVTLILFSLGSLLSGFAGSYAMLLVTRFITGFGLGGELPAASTLVSEFSPLAKRGRNVIILESFWAWGWIAAALVAYLAIPIWGWRVAFFIGAVPAAFAAVLRFAVPESPRYLAAHGRLAEAEQLVGQMEREAGRTPATPALLDGSVANTTSTASLRLAPGEKSVPPGRPGAPAAPATLTPSTAPAAPAAPSFLQLFTRPHRRATIILWVLWFGINFGYYGFVLWTPSFLVAQGFDLVKSFEFTLYMCLAQLPGYLAA